VARPVNERLERHAAAHIKRAHALGRIDFVAGNGEQVHAERVDVRGNLADRLRRVRVHQNAMLPSNAANRGDRLHRTHLVCVHDADKNRLRRDRAPHVVRIDAAKPINRNDGHLEAQSREEAAGPKDCGMLNFPATIKMRRRQSG
jgi:hypothetical protein